MRGAVVSAGRPLDPRDLAALGCNAGIPHGFAWLCEETGELHRYCAETHRWSRWRPAPDYDPGPAPGSDPGQAPDPDPGPRAALRRGRLLWRAVALDCVGLAWRVALLLAALFFLLLAADLVGPAPR
jgi:hypothetical protein